MDLRAFTLIAFFLIAPAAHATVRVYPLDERIVYTVRIGREAPTTCIFPGPLAALEGAGVSTKADDNAGVLLSHQPGTDFFSVRALRDATSGALNVVFLGRVFVLTFVVGAEPDRVIRFLDDSPASGPGASQQRPASHFRTLVTRAQEAVKLPALYPALSSSIARAEPGTETHYPMFCVTVAEVFRFEVEDALVFRLRFTNDGDTRADYDPAQLAIRVGSTIYPARWTDGSGAVAPRASAEVFVVVSSAPDGGRANLGVNERFSVIAPRP